MKHVGAHLPRRRARLRLGCASTGSIIGRRRGAAVLLLLASSPVELAAYVSKTQAVLAVGTGGPGCPQQGGRPTSSQRQGEWHCVLPCQAPPRLSFGASHSDRGAQLSSRLQPVASPAVAKPP